MKNLIATLIFLCLSHVATAKNLPTIKIKDSLQYYKNLVNHPKSPLDLSKAFKFYNEKQKISRANKDTLTTINDLRQIAIIQLRFGDYYGSETTALQVLRYLDAMPPGDLTQQTKIGIYKDLGVICKDRLDYELALKYFEKGLALATSPELKNDIKNNMAQVYIEQSKFEQSETLLAEVYNTSKQLGDSIQIARALDNLGFVEGKLNREHALYHLNEALNFNLKQNDKLGVYTSYKHLSQYYKDRKDFEQAEAFAQEAYHISKEILSASYEEDALANLISIRPNTIEYQYKILKDSIEMAKQLAENKYASIKFDYLNQEQIANEIQIQIEKERLTDILFQTMGLIIFIIAILIITMLHSKNQRDKLREIYLTETRISKKIHDEVANDVYNVMTQLERDTENRDQVLDALEDIYSRTRDISKENSSIDLNEKFEEVLRDLLRRYHSNSLTVITRTISKIDWEELESIKKITLYRILQELMVNMKKHSNATIVAITFKFSGNKLTLNYSDNGVGCHLKKYSGLQNVENRIVSLKGTANFVSRPGHGFKAEISI
ncbi:tetratricopeptide repeat protein [Gaetbulibacter sp. M240]|uniref:sensor histidine kinase n=1 Tax=Gaetbulibacter sp. M240 TaxID=3126511 RepID=UPI00374ECD2F